MGVWAGAGRGAALAVAVAPAAGPSRATRLSSAVPASRRAGVRGRRMRTLRAGGRWIPNGRAGISDKTSEVPALAGDLDRPPDTKPGIPRRTGQRGERLGSGPVASGCGAQPARAAGRWDRSEPDRP